MATSENGRYCPVCQMPIDPGQKVKSSPKGIVHEECFDLVEISPSSDEISYEIADDDDIPF